MAPPIPVYDKDEIRQMLPRIYPTSRDLQELKSKGCELFEIVQHQCTFDGNKILCLPFKRVFARCLDEFFTSNQEVIGYKLKPTHLTGRLVENEKIWRNIEITDALDNDYLGDLKTESPASVDLREFLNADKILQAKMEDYYDRMNNREIKR
ncbi:hypothetical protein DAMA08_053870 [Martiniozyma asiatica (nom. inval.)]|nr:hypothetical protein DAMA08_053870 [Martiniozyma asiatica]